MSRSQNQPQDNQESLPRTRGDEPALTSTGWWPATSAPHARGWAQRVGVVCRTRGQLSRVVAGLADHGIDAVPKTRNWPPTSRSV